jgi:DNA-binding response OmpR family regulator
MPATVVVVLNELEIAKRVARSLGAAGRDAIAVDDPHVALEVLENASQIELLVTNVDHGDGKPNGVSLALMARRKRPKIKAIFVGSAHDAHWVGGIGALMAPPVNVEEMVATITAMLEAKE